MRTPPRVGAAVGLGRGRPRPALRAGARVSLARLRGDLLVELLVAGREAFERGPGAGSDLVVTGPGA